jgi:hypothetical protein
MCVGDHDGAIEKSGFFEPGSSRHLAVAVEREPRPKNRVLRVFAAGKNGGHSGADGALADDQFAAAGD